MNTNNNGNGETRKTVAQLAKEVIEQKTSIEVIKNDIKSIGQVNDRLDTAIGKLSEISTSIKTMLAIHDEKLDRTEEVDKVLFKLMEQRRTEQDKEVKVLEDKLSKNYEDLREQIELTDKRLMCEIRTLSNNLNNRVGVLEKYRWIILGASIVIGWTLSSNFKTILQMMTSTGV